MNIEFKNSIKHEDWMETFLNWFVRAFDFTWTLSRESLRRIKKENLRQWLRDDVLNFYWDFNSSYDKLIKDKNVEMK